jgi:IclR family acetate operon transcriptional repressor
MERGKGSPEKESTQPAGGLSETGRYSIRSVERVLDILDLLQQSPEGVTLAEIAVATSLPRSSAFRYLTVLERRGYLERDLVRGVFRLGLGLHPLHSHPIEAIAARARHALEELRDRVDETVNLGVFDGAQVVYVDIIESQRAMRLAARKGDRDPLHSTALGKAIASRLPSEEVRRVLSLTGMPRLTSRTITSPELLLAALDEIRERGYALDDGENEEGARCIAVPLERVRPLIAVSVSAPAVRLDLAKVEEIAAALRETADRLAAELEPTDAHPTSTARGADGQR